MKTIATLAGVTILSLASFADARPILPVSTNAEQLVDQLLNALRHESAEGYAGLFPSLQAFHQAMEANRSFYGELLQQAQKDFDAEYAALVPELHNSFTRMLSEGKALGIDWSRISVVSWELTPSPSSSSAFQLVLRFRSADATHTLVIDKVLVMNEQVHVSHAIRIS